ncbi:hypothetical protein G6F31_016303 [Rhizopus arrhizus]|nr:hypothetical protein G6F31_016303 [Rhizopus arrhizus]
MSARSSASRVAGVALGFVHAAVHGAAVAGRDGDLADPALRVGTVDFFVQHHLDLAAEVGDCRVVQPRVKLGQPGAALAGDQRKHGAHRELGLVHGLRIDDRA